MLGMVLLLMVGAITIPFAMAWEIINWEWWVLMAPAWITVIIIWWFNRRQGQ